MPPWRPDKASLPGYHRGALRDQVGGRAWQPDDGGVDGLRRSRSSSSITGVGASPDGSVKGAGGSGSSSSLPVGTLALPGAPPLLCGEFLGWIEASTCHRGKLRLPKQCHLVLGSPSAKTGEAAGGWWNGGVLGQLSGVVVR
uniref:Flagelliform silk protein-like protein n=1 Tax=Oryza sativa subsp. indica TaxID=39946 RepID=A0A679BAN9_ORYSI|nr:flagelliform silk protein-like protein [Oryza sativa Indica Group]BBD82336.1 flagelliform silk protein-like protein [Oryza sativa Indica Group]